MLEAGVKAPEFSLQDKDGNIVSLKDFLGKKVVVYFYPRILHRGVHVRPVLFAIITVSIKKWALRLSASVKTA